ncbi:hypothetical protein COP2_013343 [Malus domestica]
MRSCCSIPETRLSLNLLKSFNGGFCAIRGILRDETKVAVKNKVTKTAPHSGTRSRAVSLIGISALLSEKWWRLFGDGGGGSYPVLEKR